MRRDLVADHVAGELVSCRTTSAFPACRSDMTFRIRSAEQFSRKLSKDEWAQLTQGMARTDIATLDSWLAERFRRPCRGMPRQGRAVLA